MIDGRCSPESSESSSPIEAETIRAIATRAVASVMATPQITESAKRSHPEPRTHRSKPRREAPVVGTDRRATRKPAKPNGRRRHVLGKLSDFVGKFDWLPSATELAAAMGRGSRWTTWRDLRILVRYGYVKPWRARWMITELGWQRLRISPIIPRFDRKPRKTYGERLVEKLLRSQRLLERTERLFRNRRYVGREGLPIVD